MSKLLERLQKSGIPQSDLDYIQRMEEQARAAKDYDEERRLLRERMAYLEGGVSRTPKGPSKFEQFLAAFDSHDNGAELKQIFGGLRDVLREEFTGEMDTRVAPLKAQVGSLKSTHDLEAYLETNMVPLYGEGIRALWPAVKAESLKRLAKDGSVVPEFVALEVDREGVGKLLVGKEKDERRRMDARSMEGFHAIERSRPSLSSGGADDAGDDDDPGRERDRGGRFSPKKFDPNAIAADVMRAMNLGPSGAGD